MRLAITGASNCGKTTLANDLGKALELEVIPEFMGEPFDATLDLDAAQEMQRFRAILKAKSTQETALENGFVSDRSPIDLGYAWLIRGLPLRYARPSMKFLKTCRELAQGYDGLIIPPGPRPDLSTANYFGKPEDIWIMWRNHNAMIGMAFQWLPAKCIYLIPPEAETREQRVAWVLENCNTS